MTDFAHANLLEIEDSIGDRVDGLTGRFSRKRLGFRDLGVSLFSHEPGVRGIAHRHREQEEAYVVVAGSGRVSLDGEVVDLRQWDVLRVAPRVPRAFEAGPDGMEVLAIGGPRPDGGDGEPAEVSWPDE